jgi:hypothetical protein
MSALPRTALFREIVHPQKRAFLLAYIECFQVTKAARHAKASHQLHYYWRDTDPVYAAAFEVAKQLAIEGLEDEAVRRARADDHPSDVLLIFLLKGLLPEKYKDRYQVEHKGAIDLYHRLATLESLDDAALDELAREVERYANGQG